MTGRTKEDWIGGGIGFVVVLPTAICVIVGIFIAVFHCLVWLDTAVWPTSTLHTGLNQLVGRSTPITTGMLGLDKILSALGDLPLKIGLIFIVPIIWIMGWVLIYNVAASLFGSPRKV
jgi:hypothetical protein